MIHRPALLFVLISTAASAAAAGCEGVHALRAQSGPPEWSDSPAEAAAEIFCRLEASSAGPATLVLRQDGVKRADWRVFLNGQELGALVADEHRQARAFDLPGGLLEAGANTLRIAPGDGERPDDIRVDRVRLEPKDYVTEGRLSVQVVDDSGEPVPARITVASPDGALLPLGVESSDGLAVRTGVVYTASGAAEIPLPAGEAVVWASRGFEYGAAREAITVERGKTRDLELRIEREIDIPGWTAGDTHVHTFELSGHGDASVAERAVTLAGEGLDWAVVTEHNRIERYAAPGGVTVIPGVEFTTRHGHFNVFPLEPGQDLPDPRLPWEEVWRELPHSDGVVAIWNHPRDDHSGYTPFGRSHYAELVAESLDGRAFPGGGMEVVNSGAMYSDPLRLVRDWMRHLNRGARMNAVGSSDSHTVAMSQVGQARTYAHTGEAGPTAAAVVAAFERGETALSYGLLAFLDETDGKLLARVYAPSWNRAERLLVFANGEQIAEMTIDGPSQGGLQWQGEIAAPSIRHDAYLAVVAVGPGPDVPFWEVQRPYQPVNSDWTPMTLGVSPALAWDGDRDGRFQTAREQAEELLEQPDGLGEAFAERDAAVAAHLGFLLSQ